MGIIRNPDTHSRYGQVVAKLVFAHIGVEMNSTATRDVEQFHRIWYQPGAIQEMSRAELVQGAWTGIQRKVNRYHGRLVQRDRRQ